jgi:hypothetical protein
VCIVGFTSGTKALPVFVNRVMSDAYDKASDMPPARVARIQKADPAEFINTTNPNNYSRYWELYIVLLHKIYVFTII